MFIYVGNLSLEVTESDLRSEFVNFGEVNSVILMNDQAIGSGQCRGCGYVEMPSVLEGESAIERLQGKSIKGRKLDVIKALPVTRKVPGTISSPAGDRRVSGFSRTTRYWGSKWRK
jgi:RNA recognition motif-containing protein